MMRWQKRKPGDTAIYMLQERCYVGTSVFIQLVGYKQWVVCVTNNEDTPQTEYEVSRKRGSVRTKKTWRTPQSAKRWAEILGRREDWLEKTGIVFKKGEKSC